MLLLFSRVVSDSVTPQTAARQASLSLPIYQSLPKFMFAASAMHWTIFSCLYIDTLDTSKKLFHNPK